MIAFLNPPSPKGGISNKDTMGGLGQIYAPRSPIRMPTLDLLRVADGLIEENALARVAGCSTIFLRTSVPTLAADLDVARELHRGSGAKIVLFGPVVWKNPAELLKDPAIAAVLCGEPESLIGPYLDGKYVSGIWTREGPGGKGAVVGDLNALPLPAWDLVPFERYDLGDAAGHRRPVLTMLASRGCPFDCSYCPYPSTQGVKWRKRSPESIAMEMVCLGDLFHARFILFRDPEFTLDRKRTLAIAAAIRERRVKIPWRAETRIDTLDPEQLEAMAAAGCEALNLGIESMDEAVLEAVKRKWTPVEKIREVLTACRQYGIRTTCFFVIGLPRETKEGVLRMIDACLEFAPDHAQFTAATPYPGTGLADWAGTQGFVEIGTGMTSYLAAMRNEHLEIHQINALCALANATWAAHKRPTSVRGALARTYFQVLGLPLARRRVQQAFPS
jgi:pyruvate-formate lyase-activating enzyme